MERLNNDIDRLIIDSEEKLYSALDKGIDDMEAGRLIPHEEAMVIVRQRLRDYVLNHKN